MGCLYISGAQCIHATFVDEDDWEIYDDLRKDMQILANQFDVEISRYCLDESDYSFVIMNKETDSKCFYSGAAFEYDMSVEVSDTFENRASDFVNTLNADERFVKFHNLNWSKPQVLYFVSS